MNDSRSDGNLRIHSYELMENWKTSKQERCDYNFHNFTRGIEFADKRGQEGVTN